MSEFDIYKAPAVSNLWSFAGLAPGKDRKVKGQKCPYNQFLRTKLCGVLGSSFLKCNSPYREYYDNMKNRLESKDWGTASKNPTDKKRPKAGHQHKAANRYMIKMFLRDLYIAWRTLEGLPVRPPYSEEYLGKQHGATFPETPRNEERATMPEKTVVSERAMDFKETRIVERAKAKEETIPLERVS